MDGYLDCRRRILSDDYVDSILDFPAVILQNIGENICYIPIDETYYAVYSSRTQTGINWGGSFNYRYIPKVYGLTDQGIGAREPFDITPLTESGILQAQRQPLALTGKNCILCIIDTGIDYTHPAFRDEAGNTRILSIWDQTIQEGTPPEGYLYGSEYTREDINRALSAEDPYAIVPSRDEIGHGSAMASVAAGSSLDGGSTYLGAAPDAELLIVKLKECKPYLREYYFLPPGVPAYEESDIMLAVKYADSFAKAFVRPVVICLGLGTNMGDHDGSSFLSDYLSKVAQRRSRAVVVGGGEEGNAGHHYRGNLSGRMNEITGGEIIERAGGNAAEYEDVEVRVGQSFAPGPPIGGGATTGTGDLTAPASGFIMEFWGTVPDLYQIAVRSPGGESIPPLRIGLEGRSTYGFIFEETTLTVQSVLVDPNIGDQLVLFRLEKPTPGVWTFRISSVASPHNGIFDLWLPRTEFLQQSVQFLRPDPFITLTEPSMSPYVLTVTPYDDATGAFYPASGRGYARSGRIRPTISAPGVNLSIIYGRQSGSHLAAALTAGAVTQFMQWAVVEGNSALAETREVSNYFIRGAVRTPGQVYPNRETGYGRLSLIGVFESLRQT